MQSYQVAPMGLLRTGRAGRHLRVLFCPFVIRLGALFEYFLWCVSLAMLRGLSGIKLRSLQALNQCQPCRGILKWKSPLIGINAGSVHCRCHDKRSYGGRCVERGHALRLPRPAQPDKFNPQLARRVLRARGTEVHLQFERAPRQQPSRSGVMTTQRVALQRARQHQFVGVR